MLPMLRKQFYLPNFADDFFCKDVMSNFFDNQIGASMPAVNIAETKDNFRIEVAAPGLNKEDFKIDLHNNVLSISSEKQDSKEEKNEKVMRREFSYTSFKRSFGLPEMVEQDQIKAIHLNGVLLVEIPKREEAKEKPARQISIS